MYVSIACSASWRTVIKTPPPCAEEHGGKNMSQQSVMSLFDYFMFEQDYQVVDQHEIFFNPPAAVVASSSSGNSKQFAYDCGEELRGARKHLASGLVKFSSEWQTAMEVDPSQAYDLVCKDGLIGSLNAENLQEEGYTSEAALVVKLIWDRVSQRPADDSVQRRYFIQAVNELRSLFRDAKTVDSVKSAVSELRINVRNAHYSQSEYQVKKNPELLSYSHWLSLGDRFKSLFVTKSRAVAGYRKIYKRAFESEEGQDWNWAKKRRNQSNRRQSNKAYWERKVPDEVIRLSEKASGVTKPEDFITQYGFRGIQFGNWVDDAAGRYHVLCSGNAWADLASILKLPPKAISFYGALGLAFGARGSGKAAAHFEVSTNVMNLTKHRGGGSQCHEWAHALDQNLYSYSHQFSNGKRALLSGSEAGPHLPAELKEAFADLMKVIKEGNGKRLVKVPDPLPLPQSRYYDRIKGALALNNYDISTALQSLIGRYRIKNNQWMDIAILYCNLLKEAGKEVPKSFYIPSDESLFYSDAKNMGAYWRRDHELFARAFESWIEDELSAAGMTNSYLVYGTQFGSPYPYGEERQFINASFRKWWEIMLQLELFTNERFWQNAN